MYLPLRLMISDCTVAALSRKESWGLHYSLDFPYADPIGLPQNTVLVPKRYRPLTPV